MRIDRNVGHTQLWTQSIPPSLWIGACRPGLLGSSATRVLHQDMQLRRAYILEGNLPPEVDQREDGTRVTSWSYDSSSQSHISPTLRALLGVVLICRAIKSLTRPAIARTSGRVQWQFHRMKLSIPSSSPCSVGNVGGRCGRKSTKISVLCRSFPGFRFRPLAASWRAQHSICGLLRRTWRN